MDCVLIEFEESFNSERPFHRSYHFSKNPRGNHDVFEIYHRDVARFILS